MDIRISDELKQVLPGLKLGGLLLSLKTEPLNDTVKALLTGETDKLALDLTPASIREMDTVKATKNAYRKLGKDPNRYRPAAESLLRRVANGKGLYHINNVVDILNLVSVKTGFSICGYDYEKLSGAITMGVGAAGEPYEGIGRGELNIEKLPVFRDTNGAFGTPTSDSVRTMVTETTTRFLFLIIGLEDSDALMKEALAEAAALYATHADATIEQEIFVD
ncbi:hypothetical protein DMA11_23160 [Marinilabiliaceae bacterium JC017]|nr:hypothetical protein DMA11_23160 [Marinilabiliaceae bacterium JC017]